VSIPSREEEGKWGAWFCFFDLPKAGVIKMNFSANLEFGFIRGNYDFKVFLYLSELGRGSL